MQFRNIEKIKSGINKELEDRISNHKKNYYLQLSLYKSESLKYENNYKKVAGSIVACEGDTLNESEYSNALIFKYKIYIIGNALSATEVFI